MTKSSEPLLSRFGLLAGFVALFFFFTMAVTAMRDLHQLLPDIYSDSMSNLLHPTPLIGLLLLMPLFSALAIYFLTTFSLSSKGGVSGTFNRASLFTLRLAGICIGLSVITDILKPYSIHWMSPEALWEHPSMTEIYVLLFVSATLITLSRHGNILFKHANKLRDDLDEIV